MIIDKWLTGLTANKKKIILYKNLYLSLKISNYRQQKSAISRLCSFGNLYYIKTIKLKFIIYKNHKFYYYN